MYNLGKTITKRSPIYHQLIQYYNYCAKVRGMTASTMQDKTYVLNSFVRYTGLRDLRKVSNQIIFDWMGAQWAREIAGVQSTCVSRTSKLCCAGSRSRDCECLNCD